MDIHRTEDPDLFSNAYLVVDKGGRGVLVDGNGVSGPLIERIEGEGIDIGMVLLTHHHGDHVDIEAYRRFRAPVLAHEATAAALDGRVDRTLADREVVRHGDLTIEAIHTPGHAAGHLALLVDGTDCLTADALFRGTVGGTRGPGATGFDDLRRSVIERLMSLPPATRLHPGHREPTTVAEEEEGNPFVRAWRSGADPRGEPCHVRGEPAELLLWGPDYDGGHKAWIRFPNGEQAVVGGSQVERGT
jgi:glyoxylase-like metal-dependent hydrolase (beta-lactamase superfamily II)